MVCCFWMNEQMDLGSVGCDKLSDVCFVIDFYSYISVVPNLGVRTPQEVLRKQVTRWRVLSQILFTFLTFSLYFRVVFLQDP